MRAPRKRGGPAAPPPPFAAPLNPPSGAPSAPGPAQSAYLSDAPNPAHAVAGGTPACAQGATSADPAPSAAPLNPADPAPSAPGPAAPPPLFNPPEAASTHPEKRFSRRFRSHRFREEWKAYAMLAFPLFWFGVFFLVGFFRGFAYSLTDYDMRFSQMRGINFIWLKNYGKLLGDPRVWHGLGVSLIWTAVMLVGNNGFGLLMAALLVRLRRGSGAFLAALYWPALVSAAVGTQVTLYLFRPTADGVMNILARVLAGAGPIPWLEQESTALLSLMIQPFFLGFSMKMLIYYAGIKGIPKMYYESASLETDSGAAVFARITLPLLAPVVFLNVILSFLDGFKVLAPMQLVTPDNPYTESLVYYLYSEAFVKTKIGYASAISFFLFAVIMAVTALQNAVQKKEVSYE